jgi:NADH:ubiquinone oxidoreductase subunit E
MKKLYVCTNKVVALGRPSCGLRGSEKLMEALNAEVSRRALPIELEAITCLGQCQHGPSMRIAGGNFHLGGDLDKVSEIADWIAVELGEET